MIRCRQMAFIVILLMMLLLSTVATATDWPVYGRTNYRTNYSMYVPGMGLGPAWSVSVSGTVLGSPVTANDQVFFGCDNGHFYAAGTDGRQLWQFRPLSRILAPAAIADDTVYIGAYDGNVYALDRRTGWLKWQASTASWLVAAPTVHSHYIIAACYAGLVYAMDSVSGRLIWRFSVGNDFIEQSPAIAGSAVFIVTVGGELIKLDLHDGQPIWREMIGGRPIAPPAISGDRIHIVCHPSASGPGGITSLSVHEGLRRWRVTVQPDRWLPPAAGIRQLYAAQGEHLYVLDEDTGVIQNIITVDGTAVGPPVFSSQRLFLPIRTKIGGALVAVDLQVGTNWYIPLRSVPTTALAVTRHAIYFGADDRRVYALSELNIAVGEQRVQFHDVWPFMEDGQVLVPVRPVLEAMGAEVKWDHATTSAIARQAGRVIHMRADPSTEIRLLAGRLIAPVRAMATALGVAVHWDPSTLKVTLEPQQVRMWSDEF